MEEWAGEDTEWCHLPEFPARKAFLASESAVSKQPPALSFVQVLPLLQNPDSPQSTPSWGGWHPRTDRGVAINAQHVPTSSEEPFMPQSTQAGMVWCGLLGLHHSMISPSPSFHSIDS